MSRPVRVLTFCGSASARSANGAVLDAVAEALARRGIDVAPAPPVLGDIARFVPEDADVLPDPVRRLADAFAAADAVVFGVPEYGGGMAGAVKNALDWMVGAGALYGRVVAVLSAGTTGGSYAIEQTARTLTWQGAHVVATLGVAGVRTLFDDAVRLVDPSALTVVDAFAARVIDAATADAAVRAALVAETLAPLGIDPLDRRPH